MPDLSGKQGGGFSLTLCVTGGSTNLLPAGLDGAPATSSSDDHVDHPDCPFGMVASQAVISGQEAPALVGVVARALLLFPPRQQVRPPLPALGPPLGSRAPPSLLG